LAQNILDNLPGYLSKEDGEKELFVQDDNGLIPSLSTTLL